MNTFGRVMIAMLSVVNMLHLLWTVWLIIEQFKTGLWYGTDLELAVLFPWLTEILCAPALIAGVVYLVMSFFHRHRKGICIANVALFCAAVVQYGLTNLLIFL